MSKIIPRKRFGQHFLTDQHVLDRIVGSLNLQSQDQVLEIGPGTGVLTECLMTRLDSLTVVELDRDLASHLTAKLDPDSITIIQQDILRFDLVEYWQSHAVVPNCKLRVVGNLPYNISTPLLFRLIESASVIKDMTFMVQKEVALRLCANVGNKNYGRLSVMSQLWLEAQTLFDVPPTAFSPPPKVDSSVIKLTPRDETHYIGDQDRFQTIVKAAFSQRRKTLRNSLKNLVDSSQFLAADIDSSLRAENLTVEKFVQLSNA